MGDTDTRVDDLLSSITGCAFVVGLDETGLTAKDVAGPKIGLRMAAECAEFVSRHGADYDRIAPVVLDLAKGKAAQARALVEHPGTAWWFDDLDPQRQAWLSIDGTLDKFIYGTPPDTMAWSRPANPSSRWERYAQKPYGNQTTSTLYGPHLTVRACSPR